MRPFELLIANKEFLGIVVSFLGIIVPLYQYLSAKRREQIQKNFEKFHEMLIKKIANQDEKSGLDEQVAVIFDLKNFPEYYPVTKRLLKKQINRWEGLLKDKPHMSWLIDEAKETINYIDKNRNFFIRIWAEFKNKYL